MEKENVLVSACLLGLSCRYDGKAKEYPEIKGLSEKYNIIPVCPEIYGGLPTPRVPSERVGGRVIMKNGKDVTESYLRGAETAYEIFKRCDCKFAVLKARSPSCGVGRIYDGSFTKTEKDGNGVTAEYLLSQGVRVYTEEDIDKI